MQILKILLDTGKKCCHDDGFLTSALLMLAAHLQFSDDYAQEEISLYRQRFEKVHGNSLNEPKLMLSLYAAKD